MEDCTVVSDLQGKQKFHLGIQTLITARSLEDTIIYYTYILLLLIKSNSFGDDYIFVNYSIMKVTIRDQKRVIKSYKIHKNYSWHDISICILSFNNSIPISLYGSEDNFM